MLYLQLKSVEGSQNGVRGNDMRYMQAYVRTANVQVGIVIV
jgi:hypothetical protein